MLHRSARAAVAEGRLEVIPVRTMAEVFEIATGVPLGAVDLHRENFEPGSALWIIHERMKELRSKRRQERKEK